MIHRTRRACLVFALSLLGLPGRSPAQEVGKPVPLFNGKNLDGWKKVNGGATYHVEGDEIVGLVDPASKQNTFLRTEKTYRNFKLELDCKLDILGNSGIQFRSHQKPGENGRVFGYQCEIDPSDRAWTAGIYDEGRRAWLFPLTGLPDAQKAFRKHDWNHFVIEALGPILKTWLNGVPCADLIDTMDDEGFFALQVHAGKEGRIRWKNIVLTEYPDIPWNAKGAGEWSPSGGGHWTIGGDGIHGTSNATDMSHGHLFGSAFFFDFAVRLKFKAIQGNAGLYFHATEGGKSGITGVQVDIDPKENTGGLYEIDGRGWLVKPKPDNLKKWLKPGEWNDLSLASFGDRVVVHLNGFKVADIVDDKIPKHGRLALQVHAGQDVDVWFKDIEVLNMSPP
jgi:Domain of Unknown Function (DUF1080)